MNEKILQGLETPLLSYRRSAASAGQPAPSDGDRLGLSASDCPAAATLTPRPVSQTSDFTESQPGPPGAGAGTRSGPRLRAAAKFPSWPEEMQHFDGDFRRFQEDALPCIGNSSRICCVVVFYHILADQIVCIERFLYFFSVASYCSSCCIDLFTEEMPAPGAMTT
jgi:hypothetical protein